MTIFPLLLLLLLGQTTPSGDALTDLDRLRIENVGLQAKLTAAYDETDRCRIALSPFIKAANDRALADVRAKLKADLESAHPCCTFDPATGALTPKPALVP